MKSLILRKILEMRGAGSSPLTKALSVSAAHRPPTKIDGQKTAKKHMALILGFVGTNYFGIQTQRAQGTPGQPTVADALRAALLKSGGILPSNFDSLERTKFRISSRTDKGVHAANAVVSLKMETLEHMLRPMGADALGIDRMCLTEEEVERINSLLPHDVRLFGGVTVRKSFEPRECASHRVYEYILPTSALGSNGVDKFDSALQLFEGTQRFHNFCSGLRQSEDKAGVFEFHGEEWRLALPLKSFSSAEYRTVFSCRVKEEFKHGGQSFVIIRIAGISFVLHQIRHMIGSALAVAHNLVPSSAVVTALRSPLWVDVSPLAPGAGLLLDHIGWCNMRDGSDEVCFPDACTAEANLFKRERIYKHICQSYLDGSIVDDFLSTMQDYFTYSGIDFEKLKRVNAGLKEHIHDMALTRRKERAENRELTAKDEFGDESQKQVSSTSASSKRQKRRNGLPGGLFTQICMQFNHLPGQESFRYYDLLLKKAERGEVLSNLPYETYIQILRDELGPSRS